LGEQSIKSLRGKKGEDMIWNGGYPPGREGFRGFWGEKGLEDRRLGRIGPRAGAGLGGRRRYGSRYLATSSQSLWNFADRLKSRPAVRSEG
jgi:hypothetical protein